MVRAAAIFADAADAVDLHAQLSPTVLRPAVAAAAPPRDSPGAAEPACWADGGERAIAEAFLTNRAGGAACYDVDVSMVAEGALTEHVSMALEAIKRSMTFADAAAWRVARADGDANVASVVASLTSSSRTDEQVYVLRIDLAAPRPIVGIEVHELTSVKHPDVRAFDFVRAL